jgi:hypothetical protein
MFNRHILVVNMRVWSSPQDLVIQCGQENDIPPQTLMYLLLPLCQFSSRGQEYPQWRNWYDNICNVWAYERLLFSFNLTPSKLNLKWWATLSCFSFFNFKMHIVIYCASNQVVCFEGPLDIFGGMVKVVCIHDIGEKLYMNSLWKHSLSVY